MTIPKIENKKTTSLVSFWSDDIITDFYKDYYQNLNSKQLDVEITYELNTLTSLLKKLPTSERALVIDILAKVVEFYIESKVEKEIETSFEKFLNL